MNFGQLADVLTGNAKSYRNGKLANEIVPQLIGQPINEQTVRQMVEPYITQVNSHLPAETQQMVRDICSEGAGACAGQLAYASRRRIRPRIAGQRRRHPHDFRE